MYVLFHGLYGFLSDFHVDSSGLKVDFESDWESAIQFDDCAQWYPFLSFFASYFAGSLKIDHQFLEIHKMD